MIVFHIVKEERYSSDVGPGKEKYLPTETNINFMFTVHLVQSCMHQSSAHCSECDHTCISSCLTVGVSDPSHPMEEYGTRSQTRRSWDGSAKYDVKMYWFVQILYLHVQYSITKTFQSKGTNQCHLFVVGCKYGLCFVVHCSHQ